MQNIGKVMWASKSAKSGKSQRNFSNFRWQNLLWCVGGGGGGDDKSNVPLLWGGALRDETKTAARENMKKWDDEQ